MPQSSGWSISLWILLPGVLLLLYAVADHRGGISGDGFGQREYHGNGGSSTKGGGRGQVDYGQLREEVRDLFKHGYEGYMKYAYPADELRPISCKPLYRDTDAGNFGLNDIHANASITLLDVLSTLPHVHPAAFPSALKLVTEEVSFDSNVKVQVFEMTIRALGSLLSTWQYLDSLPPSPQEQASQLDIGLGTLEGVNLRDHKGKILALAVDLANRLMPAFNTPTGIPIARVNLRTGVEKGESADTCAAGAGSLILEFAVLSRLTGDKRYETAAKRAFLEIWLRRSQHNLIGNTIGAVHGQWLVPGMSGIGAGMDSFYEYALKAAILLDDDTYLDIFQDSYAAIQTHVRTSDGFIYRPIQFRQLQTSMPSTIDSLSAFFPGVQVLGGDVESAIKAHLVFWNLWDKHSAMPESWDWVERRLEWKGYPGRPEFIESTYYLYRATKDDFYLRVGRRILDDLRRRTKTKCGFATMRNVETGELEDRMESFVLSESLKYLFLLFDAALPSEDKSSSTRAGKKLSNTIFTTEGHLLSLPINKLEPMSVTRRKLHKGENQYCPVYTPPTVGGSPGRGLVVGIERRADYDYARMLVRGEDVEPSLSWDDNGVCTIPSVSRFSVDITLTPHNASGETPQEDPSPSSAKVRHDDSGDFYITDVTGLKFVARWRLDNQGYDVVSIGPHRVRLGQRVFVSDTKMEGYLPVSAPPVVEPSSHPIAEVLLRFSTITTGMDGKEDKSIVLHAIGATATFGHEFGTHSTNAKWTLGGGPLTLLRPAAGSETGCTAITRDSLRGSGAGDSVGPFVLILERGGCTFLEKMSSAWDVGAKGVLVLDKPVPQELLFQDLEHLASLGGMDGFEGGQEELQQLLEAITASASGTTDESHGSGSGANVGSTGLIRPSTEKPLFDQVKGIKRGIEDMGMVFTAQVIGDVLVRTMDAQEKDCEARRGGDQVSSSGIVSKTRLAVELIRVEQQTKDTDKRKEEERRARQSQGEGGMRLGRLALGEWEIHNLKIIEEPRSQLP